MQVARSRDSKPVLPTQPPRKALGCFWLRHNSELNFRELYQRPGLQHYRSTTLTWKRFGGPHPCDPGIKGDHVSALSTVVLRRPLVGPAALDDSLTKAYATLCTISTLLGRTSRIKKNHSCPQSSWGGSAASRGEVAAAGGKQRRMQVAHQFTSSLVG